VADCFEHGDDPWGFMKCGLFLDQLSVLLASQGLFLALGYQNIFTSSFLHFIQICVGVTDSLI